MRSTWRCWRCPRTTSFAQAFVRLDTKTVLQTESAMIETSAWSRAAVTVVDAATGQPVMQKVYFDFQHHSYGQRGFVHCKHPDHGTCIGHAYTQGFASRAEFCAAMHKWASSSPAFATREEHVALKPEPSMGRPLPETMVVREF